MNMLIPDVPLLKIPRHDKMKPIELCPIRDTTVFL